MIKRYAVAAIVGMMIVSAGCKKKETEKETVKSIDVAEAYTDSVVLYKTFPGVVTAGTKVNVVVQVNGRLLDDHFSAGQFVNKGQKLFTIESTVYRDAVQKAEADLATARSQYDYYSKRYAAMNKALEADAVSKMEVYQAQSNMEQAAAAIKTAEAALSTARLNLSYCTVTAPVSGFISAPSPEPGNYIYGAGNPFTMCQIFDVSHVTANFHLSQDQYTELVGANGGLSSEVYRNVPLAFKEPLKRTYTTDLYYEAPVVSQTTGTILMQGRIENPDAELKDGMYTTISLPYGSDPKAVLVKDASIGSDQLGKYMYVVNDSNKVVYTPVTIGDLYRDSLRVIKKGIEPGQKYVTKALLNVRRGEEIKPVLTK